MRASLVRHSLVPVLALGLVFALAGPSEARAAAKVYVVPYAPAYKQLPLELGVRTASLMSDELSAQKKVDVLAAPGGEEDEATPANSLKARAKALGRAERLAVQGDEALAALSYDGAISRYRAALKIYKQNLAYVTDFDRVVDLHLQLAVALFRQHNEQEGERLLADVIRIAPGRELDADKYPPLFVRTWEGIRKKLLRLARGAASVVSDPPGAEVFLDGRSVGHAPILMKDMVRGTHYLRIEAPGVDPWAETVEVEPTQVAQVEVSLGGGVDGPAGALVDALTRNSIDAGVVAKAKAFGKKVGADYLVLGLLAKGTDAYQVKSFLFDVAKGRLAELGEVAFDFELLGAAIEVYKLAGEVAEGTTDFPVEAIVPLTPFRGLHRGAPVQLTEVVVGPPIPRQAPIAPPPSDVAQAAEAPKATPVAATVKPRPAGPVTPVAPVAPSEDAKPARREPAGPLAAGAISVEDEGAQEPAPEVGRPVPAQTATGPVGPVGPVTPQVKPESPAGEDGIVVREAPRERQVVTVGGPRARLLDSDLEKDDAGPRFSAVDVEDIVIPKDEIKEEKGWPWWAWGLLAVGVAGAGAGGYYAATQMGGSNNDMAVKISW